MLLKHITSLDGLRAIAILIVFVAHSGFERVIPGGLGVTVFFFLSGYLITTLLRSEMAQTGKIDIKAFYVRRTVRIWPSLYITIFIVLIISQWFPSTRPIEFWGVVSQLAFLTNYPGIIGNPNGVVGPPLWSLAVEEHFYLVFPIIFSVFLAAIPSRRSAMICFAACGAVLAIRIGTVATTSNIGQVYYWTHTRIDSILFGCCLALWQNPALDRGAWRPGFGHFVAATSVLVICLLIRDEVFRQTLRYSLQGCALFVIFSFIIQDEGRISNILSSKPLRIIALYSYTLYLIHVPVINWVQAVSPGLGVLGLVIVSGAISMLYAAAMYSFVERPAADWRKRLYLKKAKATVAA